MLRVVWCVVVVCDGVMVRTQVLTLQAAAVAMGDGDDDDDGADQQQQLERQREAAMRLIELRVRGEPCALVMTMQQQSC